MDWIKEIIAEKDEYKKFLLYEEALINISGTPNLIPDVSKALLEAVCKTILADIGGEVNKDWEVKKLVTEAFNSLKIIKLLKDKDQIRSKQIIGCFQTIIRNLAELRNEYGFLSHGKDIELNEIDKLIAELCIKSSDVIGGFLLKSHISFTSINELERLRYNDYEEFNQWYDENNLVTVNVSGVQVNYSASETLFSLDRNAYKDELVNHVGESQND